jgi:putative ABC transport system permease protein
MTWGRLLRRHLRLSAPRWAGLAAVVAVAAALAMVWPRWITTTTTTELRRDLGRASATFVDPSAAPRLRIGPQDATGSADPWQGVLGSLRTVRDGAPAPLPALLGDPGAWCAWPAVQVPTTGTAELGMTFVQPASSPALLDRATIVEGRPPSSTPPAAPEGVDRIEILLSERSAEVVGWHVGEARQTAARDADLRVIELVLVGTFRPDDESSGYWQHAAELLRPTFTGTADTGPIATARAVIDLDAALEAMTGALTTRVWLPLDVAGVDAGNAAAVADGLRATLGAASFEGRPIDLSSDAPARIEQVLDRASSAGAVLALAVGAPAGVLLALLGLGARVAVSGRAAAQLLTALRGGSLAQHRALLAVEAALVCLPAAALGGLAATWLVPAPASPWWWLAPAVLGAAPVVGLATGTPWPRDGVPARVALEVGTVALAVAATIQLGTRGAAGAGPDPLASLTPLLLALAASVGSARLLPVLLRPLANHLRRRDALVAPLAATLAARRTAPVVATVAVLTGAAVTVLGVLTGSSVDASRHAAAMSVVGADVRVRGVLDSASLAAVRDVPGVAEIATVSMSSSARVTVGTARTLATLVAVDASLADVQRDVPGRVPVPGPGEIAVAGPIPVEVGDRLTLGASDPVDVTVSARPTTAPGVTGSRTWVLVDRRTLGDAGARLAASAAYLALTPDADPARVAADVRAVVGPSVDVSTAVERLAAVRTAPTAVAMSTGVLVVTGAGLLAAAAAVALSLAAGAGPRTRTVAVLRTLGLPPRAELRLVLWEAAPAVGLALVVGSGLGVGLASLLLTSTDLRPFTGGDVAAHLVASPASVLTAVAVLVVLAVGSIAVSASAAARRSAAVVLRAGEDRT